jgi:hypothetical protein
MGLNSLKSLNLTNGYPNNNKNKNNKNKVKSKPLELFKLAGKNLLLQLSILITMDVNIVNNCHFDDESHEY